jgi:hypothetical protein
VAGIQDGKSGVIFFSKNNIKILHYLKEEYEYECGLYPGND